MHDQFQAAVPTVIAHNAELNCFLMKDAGQPLRKILKQKFDEVLLCRAIEQFTALQIAIADRVDILLDTGVPDYRLDKLLDLYQKLILQKDLLTAEGLSKTEINKLDELLPKVSALCKNLANYSVKQTIVQPDFNDNNTLIDDTAQNITIIDLGEIVISHPFFSLLNCLRQIKKHHVLTDDDYRYQQIKESCFKNYMHVLISKQELSNAIETAQRIEIVYRIVYGYRFMAVCGKEELVSFQHWIPGKLLKEFMTEFTHTDVKSIK